MSFRILFCQLYKILCDKLHVLFYHVSKLNDFILMWNYPPLIYNEQHEIFPPWHLNTVQFGPSLRGSNPLNESHPSVRDGLWGGGGAGFCSQSHPLSSKRGPRHVTDDRACGISLTSDPEKPFPYLRLLLSNGWAQKHNDRWPLGHFCTSGQSHQNGSRGGQIRKRWTLTLWCGWWWWWWLVVFG